MSSNSHELWQVAGWTMVHYSWIGALLGIAILAGRQILKPCGPRLRYLVAVASLGVLTLAPVAIAGFIGRSVSPEIRVTAPVRSNGGLAVVAAAFEPGGSAPAPIATATTGVEHSVHPDSLVATVVEFLPWLWLVGALTTASLIVVGVVGTQRLRRMCSTVAAEDLVDRLRRLSRLVGVSRSVSIGLCERIGSPILIGIIRPMIVLPAAAMSGWSPEQIEMILLHELAHVQRRDNMVNFLQRVTESLLFFQPAVWFVSNWVRREREHCCDDFVIRHTGRPHAYAETLACLADSQLPVRQTLLKRPLYRRAASAMAENHVVARIRSILNPTKERLQVSWRTVTTFLLTCVVLVGLTQWCGSMLSASRGDAVEPLTAAELALIEQRSADNSFDAGKTRVAGIVVDEQGRPAPDIHVRTAGLPSSETPSATTDTDGVFLLDLDTPSLSVLAIVAGDDAGTKLGFHQFGDQSSTQARRDIRIVLKPGRATSVSVTDSHGVPVPDAPVEVIALYMPIDQKRTDEHGKAQFVLPVDANVDWIVALKPEVGFDYFENYGERPILDTEEVPGSVSLVLDGARSVTVRAIDASENPVGNLTLSPLTIRKPGKRFDVNLSGSQIATTVTDEQGVAVFKWLPADLEQQIGFLSRSSKYHTPEWTVYYTSNSTDDVTMRLTQCVRLTGRVVHSDRSPAPGILLQAEGHGSVLYGRHHARTKTDGTYEFDAFPNRDYIIAVLDEQWAARSLTGIRVEEGEPLDGLDLELMEGTLIRGTANTPSDIPAEYAHATLIQLGSVDSEILVRWAQVDEHGNYQFRVGPGRYHVSGVGVQVDVRSLEQNLLIGDDQQEIVKNLSTGEPHSEIAKSPPTRDEQRAKRQDLPGTENLKQIGLALHNYHDIFRRFPPAVLHGPDGETKYSWRVELLPLLPGTRGLRGATTRAQYDAAIKACGYDTTAAWDSPVNAAVLNQMPDVFRHPGEPSESTTSAYYAITGTGTAFDTDEVSQYTDYMDPAGWISSTLMIAESRKLEPWTKPVDIPYSPQAAVPSIGGYSDSGALILTGDGAVHFLPDTIGETDRRALITKSQDDTFTIIGIPFQFNK